MIADILLVSNADYTIVRIAINLIEQKNFAMRVTHLKITYPRKEKKNGGIKVGLYKNKEGYKDPTAGKAVQSTIMPYEIRKIYNALNHIASLHSLEIIGIRDKKTGKEWRG